MKRRVVVTGLGAVTPIGNTVDDTWASIRAGKCGVGPITQFDASNHKVKIAAEVKDFDPSLWIDRKEARKMARFTQFVAVAAAQAIADSGFDKETIAKVKSGITIGNGIGGFEVIEASMKKYFEAGPDRIPPLSIPLLISNEGAGNISMLYGITGASWTLATACASSTDSLGLALDQIRSGRLDVCVAGGTEAAVTGFGIGGFTVLQALAANFNDDPQRASRPFDRDRSGFIMGEGAGILILEELEHAKARGAKIYAEFAGYGASSDAYHITSPSPDGAGGALAITRALEDAGVRPEDVQYYNAHGTSTPVNDPAETLMIKKAFGDHAYKMKISSTKGMTGHCVGAAGAVEAIICIKAINDGYYPPTINLENPDLEHGCDLDYVPNVGIEAELACAASGSLGFGGHNGVLVMRKYKA
jgi:3-oxoacyl-[acyl-carrier-protein] synthase II